MELIINELLSDVKCLMSIQEQLITVNTDLAIKLNTQIDSLIALVKRMQESLI